MVSIARVNAIRFRSLQAFTLAVALVSSGCVGPAAGPIDPMAYRLRDSGSGWHANGSDEVLADLEGRYPEFFAVILDAALTQEPEIRKLRHDLESPELGRERFDALNAVAIAYFELNGRAQGGLEVGGGTYLADSFRATKLLSIPWRAYREIGDPALRDAILDFYQDIAEGEKEHAAETAPRILRLVESLEKKETDPGRIDRIRGMGDALRARVTEG